MGSLNLTIPSRAWVVVCDGAKALILENAGDAEYPDLRTRQAQEQPDRRTREIGTDAPGRSINSVGNVRSAMEQTDWHDQNESRFLADLVAELDAAVQSGAVRQLVIVAPPRALGALRSGYTEHVRRAVVAEVDKDLVALPIKDIEKHLVGDRSLMARKGAASGLSPGPARRK